MNKPKTYTLKCKKSLERSGDNDYRCMFIQGISYTMHNQNERFCIMLNRNGQKFAFTRNKENNKIITDWIEEYFDYSSPTSTRTVIVEKYI